MSIIDDLIPHMHRVQSAERDLRDLSLLWQMIEASSAISCPEEAEAILPMLEQTRTRFAGLQGRLVEQLGAETVAELRDELASSAQCTIDILVRNLFERTADVGFLATDNDLRAFCAADAAQRDALRDGFVRRLAEYRAKYTVYDDIILLGGDGRVLARLDTASKLEFSAEPIVGQALARPGYVEQFALSDLGAGDAPALLYGHRVDDGGGRPVGVLVLRFRKIDEMQRIFASVVDAKRQVALLLLDAEGRVIASNDEAHVPIGALMQTAPDGEVALTAFAGREYLCVTRETHGYQGYCGPAGWRAQAMVSLLTAFRSRAAEGEGAVDTARDDEVALDNPELSRIQTEVDAINGDLRRVVWNGRLVAGARAGAQARLKAVLKQINEAGSRTRDRVAIAIEDLYRTSLGRARHQARELARLAADIMDRNLYERANDCRWWALSPVLERVLAEPAAAAGTQELNAVLAHVNSLYTVYTRLVAFDAAGTVRGLSNDIADAPLLGATIPADWLQATLALADSQRYAVSAFAGSPLSGGVPTYVYLATVRDSASRAVVGGIAIVFNAEREFRAMLDDVLGSREGLAAFVDGEGRVLSSTSEALTVGSVLPFEPARSIVEHAGGTYAAAAVVTGGYREFKRSDGYDNHVRAVVALHLGNQERRLHPLHDTALQALPSGARNTAREFALFHLGGARFALPAEMVMEARPPQGLVRAPIGLPHAAGLLEVPSPQGSVVIPVICGRSVFGADHPPRSEDGVVLVLRAAHAERPLMGLRVDDVISVVDIAEEHRQPAPAGLRSHHSPLLECLLRVGTPAQAGGEVLVQLIDGAGLLALSGSRRAAEALAA